MTNRLVLNWKVDGFVDEQRYYCSETPIDPENLPAPKAVIVNGMKSYSDTEIVVGKRYFVRIGAIKNGVQKLSQQSVIRAGTIDPIPSATSTSNQNTANLSMAVPTGAVVGDQMLVILRARVDRSFVIPVGWSILLETSVPAGSSSTADVKVYILAKAFNRETNLTFQQNTAAACSGMVVLIKGKLGVPVHSFTSPIAYTKVELDSYLLVLTFDNNYPTVSGVSPRVSPPEGYTQIGHSFFISSTEFYGIFADKKGTETSGTKSIAINWPGTTADQCLVAVIEVMQG